MSEDIEVLLNNNDITVLGPPRTVDVSIDIGAKGTRGSQIFAGIGNPNIVSIGQTPELNDLYINASPGADYGYMYQYVAQPGGNTWIELLKVSPTLYNENHLITFVSGAGSVTIPIENITSIDPSSLTSANFNVQCTVANDDPVAFSISIPALTGDDLVLNIEAVEYASSSWQALSGDITVHIFISITS